MANREFFFFFAPTWDYPPDGPIKLGNVITSVKKPHLPLSCVPPPQDSDVLRTDKRTVRYTEEKLRGGKFSILTKFLSILGFGVDLGGQIDKSVEETFIFDTLGTTQFIPTPAYLQTCIEEDNVRRFLEASRYRKPVYIITGIKVVNGAAANTQNSKTLGGTIAVEVDGTLLSGGTVPVGGGPTVEGKVEKKSGTSWEGSNDFVFAFRVSKVFASKATGLVTSEEEYRKGAMLDHKTGEIKHLDLSVVKVEEPNAEAEGFDTEELRDDEDLVFCAIPREVDSSD